LRFKLYVRSVDSLSNPLEQDGAVIEDNEAVANLRLRINLLSLAMIRAGTYRVLFLDCVFESFVDTTILGAVREVVSQDKLELFNILFHEL
jgi:hypothetical protein